MFFRFLRHQGIQEFILFPCQFLQGTRGCRHHNEAAAVRRLLLQFPGNGRNGVAAQAVSQHKDPLRIDLFLFRQQLHRVHRVIDRFVHQRDPAVIRHRRAVNIGPFVEAVYGNALFRQAFRDIPERSEAHDSFVLVAGAGALDQHHRRERTVSFGHGQDSGQLSKGRYRQVQLNTVKKIAFCLFFLPSAVGAGLQAGDSAVLNNQDQIHRHQGERAGNAERFKSGKFPFHSGADLSGRAQRSQ